MKTPRQFYADKDIMPDDYLTPDFWLEFAQDYSDYVQEQRTVDWEKIKKLRRSPERNKADWGYNDCLDDVLNFQQKKGD